MVAHTTLLEISCHSSTIFNLKGSLENFMVNVIFLEFLYKLSLYNTVLTPITWFIPMNSKPSVIKEVHHIGFTGHYNID